MNYPYAQIVLDGSTIPNKLKRLFLRKEPEATARYPPSAHFPKFVLHPSTHFHELRKVMGTSKHIDSSAAFLFDVPGSNSPLVAQERQIGGTSMPDLPAGSLQSESSPICFGREHGRNKGEFKSLRERFFCCFLIQWI
jgi:hypothetical protein